MTDARIVYASSRSLYLATEPWSARPLPAAPTKARSADTTQIHGVDISDSTKTSYLGWAAFPLTSSSPNAAAPPAPVSALEGMP